MIYIDLKYTCVKFGALIQHEAKPPVVVGQTKPPVVVGQTKPPVVVGQTKPPVVVGQTKPPVVVGHRGNTGWLVNSRFEKSYMPLKLMFSTVFLDPMGWAFGIQWGGRLGSNGVGV